MLLKLLVWFSNLKELVSGHPKWFYYNLVVERPIAITHVNTD